jgi:uncharacterized protein YcbK (DUF882 family)
MITASSWKALQNPRAWPWRDFTPREMSCRATGRVVLSSGFMDKLQAIRDAMDRPLVVTSGYRTPEHNARVSTTGTDGPHTTGHAADIACYGKGALDLVHFAVEHGMTGIGQHQRGSYEGRFVHLDDLPQEPGQPRPWPWTY